MGDRAAVWPQAEVLGAPLPGETDVVVVGGGLAGCALAYYLAGEGVEVAVVERGELNREASGTNAGSFHFQIAIHQLTSFETGGAVRQRLLDEVRLLAGAASLWSDLEAELDGALDVHITGGLMAAETAQELQLLREKMEIEKDAGLETHLLVGAELRSFAPFLADDLAGAVYCPQEGHANPLLAAPLYARRALERGAAIRTHAPVTRIDLNEGPGAHRFTVHTARGSVRARRLVNAGGAWANRIAALNGLRFPLRAEGLHLNVTEPRPRILVPMVQHIGRRLTLKQSSSGTFIIGGGWPTAAGMEHPPTLWQSVAGNTAVAVRVVPALADVRVVRTWSGVMAFTYDLSPVIGETAQLPGYHLLVATTGFTLGPYMARLLAEQLATGGTLPPQFSPDRMTTPLSAPTI
jgi:glycine/D-amino acid oxidase-like deaminating enzyme